MITAKGKTILSKYLANGVSPYASYIAVGCGARPRTIFSVNITSTESSTANAGNGNAKIITSTNHDFQIGDYVKIYNNGGSNINSVYLGTWLITSTTSNSFKFLIGDNTVRTLASPSPSPKVILDFSNKTNMDFEMLRLPINTRTSFVENGLSVIELSANLPSTERYEISEIGVYSANSDSNTNNGINNKVIYNFSVDESWSYHNSSTISNIPFISTKLDSANNNNTIDVANEVFQANSNNSVFSNTARLYKQERPRYEKNVYFITGNTSSLINSSGTLTPTTYTNHIEKNISGLGWLDKASPEDEIRFAFSLVAKENAFASPDDVRILLEFATEDNTGSETNTYKYARFHGIRTNAEQDFSTNRYIVIKKKMSELQKSQNFSWSNVAFVKIYVSIFKNSARTSEFYAALDSLKFEYTTTTNPLYGLTGYTVIKNSNNLTVSKEENAEQSITFRFIVGV